MPWTGSRGGRGHRAELENGARTVDTVAGRSPNLQRRVGVGEVVQDVRTFHSDWGLHASAHLFAACSLAAQWAAVEKLSS